MNRFETPKEIGNPVQEKNTSVDTSFLYKIKDTPSAESKGSSGLTIKKFLLTVGAMLLASAVTDALPVESKFSSQFGDRSPAYPTSSTPEHSFSPVWVDSSGKRTVQTSLVLDGKKWTASVEATYPKGDPLPETVLNLVDCKNTNPKGPDCVVEASTTSFSFSGDGIPLRPYRSTCAEVNFGGGVETPYHICTPPIDAGVLTKRDETSNPAVTSPECPVKSTEVNKASDVWTDPSGETVQTFLEVDCSGWTARMEVHGKPFETSITLMECDTDGSNCTPKHTIDGMLLGGYDNHVGAAYQACSTVVFENSNVTDLCTPLIPIIDQQPVTLNKCINDDEVD